MKETQWKKLYQAMQKGRRLTALDCFKLCGTLNAHKRIRDVEKQTSRIIYRGWKRIGGRTVEGHRVGGKRIREYFL